MKKVLICLSVFISVLAGCSKTNEEVESKNSQGNSGGTAGNCDTVYMRYSADVQPILQANCYSCHGNGRSESGVSLDTYNQVKQRAANGSLIGVITHTSGYPAMPFNKPKLPDCDINKIKDWIAWGSLNN